MLFRNCPFFRLTNFYKNKLRNYSNSISSLFEHGKVGDEIHVKGWIRSLRKQKQVTFLDINDGSTGKKLQVVLPHDLHKEKITTGASINVLGILKLSNSGQIEIQASEVEVYGECVISDGYPFSPKKEYTPEYIRQYLHFRPRTQKFASLLRIRSTAVTSIYEYFKKENYIHIHTPAITSNDCEGAGEVFKVAPDSNDLLKSMSKNDIPLEDSFFSKRAYLSVSGQLHLETAVHGLSKVYSLSPIFRAENSKSRLHLSEFYMLEAEVAFMDDLNDLMKCVEKLLKAISKNIIDSSENDLDVLHINEKQFSWLNVDFPILTFTEAMDILKKNVEKFQEEYHFEKGFSKEQELFLVNHLGGVPIFIINWPKNMKPFYMKECPNDHSNVLAFDLLVPNVGELVGGSLRENDYKKLKALLQENDDLEWYLDLRKFGSVPTGGYGLGFERYLMFLLGIENIKDVIPFPRWPHNCSL